MEDRRNVGESSCNFGDETDQRVQSVMFVMMMMISYNKKKLTALISQICFWNKTLHVSDSSSVHHQEFFITVHTAMEYVIQVCCAYSEKLLMMDRGTVRNM